LNPQDQPPSGFPLGIRNPSGLSVQVNANGSIRRIDHGDILINLFLGTEVEGGPANLYLRCHGAAVEATALLGPGSPAAFHFGPDGMTACGQWKGIRFRLSLALAKSQPAWFWHVALSNTGGSPETLDLVYAQDLGLAHYGAVRINEYYTSHYVDHTALLHPQRGFVLCSRQNLPMGGRNPWTVIGSLGRAVRYATDALQIHGFAARAGRPAVGLIEGLPGIRRQHEHSMAAVQDAPLRLQPGETRESGFFGWYEAHHEPATSSIDLAIVDRVLGLPEAIPPPQAGGFAAGGENRGAECGGTTGRETGKGSGAAGYGPARPVETLFSSAPLLDALDLNGSEIEDLFGPERRHEEREDGRLLSFFAGTHRHVVLREKDLKVLRPHVHILRTGSRLTPDEAALTSTAWMDGVFHSMVTQGHVSINRFLSTVHGYLSLLRADGQRIFVETDRGWRLLGMPSAFEMTPQACRWVYKHRDGMTAVRSAAGIDRHEMTLSVDVLSGPPVRLLLVNHLAVGGDDGSEAVPAPVRRDGEGVFVGALSDTDLGRRFPDGGFHIAPLPGTSLERIGGDELLFSDGRSRNQPFLCLVTGRTCAAAFRMKGRLIPEPAAETAVRHGPGPAAAVIAPKTADPREAGPPDESRFWTDLTARLRIHPPAGSALAGEAARLEEIVPWFVHNALIHYLAPRGIEQYTGGGWGTRDISQGPVELLLALGRLDPVRDLLVRVFSAQNPDGDWPQWFMFFDRERNIRPPDSHGDIVFWPLAALAAYLAASEDADLLDEKIPFFHPEGASRAEQASLWGHVERALNVIGARVIPGTRLAAYGHGDWNDSMQPFDPAMRERLCSAWTVTLHVQTLTALAGALRSLGRSERACELESSAAAVREEFRRRLLVDGTVAGLAYFREDGRIEYFLHPRDRSTGVSYSLLPMIHAVIDDLFTPEQARDHLKLIRLRLTGPDGARLFDRPMAYRGGPQKHFQRAESAAFFGREIGLMYTHAHLRYAEALARYGDADGFFLALCQANPIGIRALVPAATIRQANCYYSSSDAAFSDRYQASAEYDRALRGEIPLDGGWRIYSSGAGIWTKLLFSCLLGVSRRKSCLVVDPVIPRSLDGLKAEMELEGRTFEITYRVRAAGSGPLAVSLNGGDLPFTRQANPYRTGAAEIPMRAVRERLLREEANRMTVHLG
jgi:cellobiose phosphorylase